MKKHIQILGIGLASLLLLSGCLYPKQELAKNKVPNDAQLEMVQSAVEQYKDDNDGLVPIKTKENDVDPYEKYLIDFTVLKESQILSEVPGSAYENGGLYQYIILHPEDDPEVKVIDLRLSEKLRDVNTKLDIFRSKNTYPPFGKQIVPGVYKLDYKALGYDAEPYAVSPFSNENLPFVLDENGDVYIDYRIDLRQALETYDHDYKEGDDIRSILEENYPFVPVYSLPYTIEDDDPAFLLK